MKSKITLIACLCIVVILLASQDSNRRIYESKLAVVNKANNIALISNKDSLLLRDSVLSLLDSLVLMHSKVDSVKNRTKMKLVKLKKQQEVLKEKINEIDLSKNY